jgi:hypothetical protein
MPTVTPRRRRAWRGWPAGLLAAICLSGCGSSGHGPPPPDPAALFAAHCAVCHSFGPIRSPTQQGGNLQGLNLSRSQIRQFVVEMPQVKGPLDRRQIQALTQYLLNAGGR